MKKCLDSKIEWLYRKISEGVAQLVTVFTSKINNYPCRFSEELINNIRTKKEGHAKYNRSHYKVTYNEFCKLRMVHKKISRDCHNCISRVNCNARDKMQCQSV